MGSVHWSPDFSEHWASDSRWQCEMGNLSLGSDFLEISPEKKKCLFFLFLFSSSFFKLGSTELSLQAEFCLEAKIPPWKALAAYRWGCARVLFEVGLLPYSETRWEVCVHSLLSPSQANCHSTVLASLYTSLAKPTALPFTFLRNSCCLDLTHEALIYPSVAAAGG